MSVSGFVREILGPRVVVVGPHSPVDIWKATSPEASREREEWERSQRHVKRDQRFYFDVISVPIDPRRSAHYPAPVYGSGEEREVAVRTPEPPPGRHKGRVIATVAGIAAAILGGVLWRKKQAAARNAAGGQVMPRPSEAIAENAGQTEGARSWCKR